MTDDRSMKYCNQCDEERPADNFRWVYDHNGIPFRYVCSDECELEAHRSLRRYDDMDDGTPTEPDYDWEEVW